MARLGAVGEGLPGGPGGDMQPPLRAKTDRDGAAAVWRRCGGGGGSYLAAHRWSFPATDAALPFRPAAGGPWGTSRWGPPCSPGPPQVAITLIRPPAYHYPAKKYILKPLQPIILFKFIYFGGCQLYSVFTRKGKSFHTRSRQHSMRDAARGSLGFKCCARELMFTMVKA